MRDKSEILREVENLTKEYFASQAGEDFIPGKTKIPLNVPSYNWEEACEAIETLLTTWVTMGKKVQTFEEMFARYVGVPHGVMVNSGSSANLLALSVLTNHTCSSVRTRDLVASLKASSMILSLAPVHG